MSKILIGIDWGGTFLKLGIFDERGKLLSKERVESKALASPAKFFSFLHDLLLRRLKEKGLGFKELKGVGIGAPGMIKTESGLFILPTLKAL